MAISKIILNGVTQMDLTQDTVAAANLISPNTAHDAAGLPVTGTATAGMDIPVFTVTYDSTGTTIQSITCNKTYAQCYEMLETNEETTAAALQYVAQGDSTVYEYSVSYVGYVGGSSSRLMWTVFSSGGNSGYLPIIDILYASTGTITLQDPSQYTLTLNATTNGTYTPSDGMYTEVNVNVPTGTARTSADLSASGATVTAPAGLYAAAATYTIASGSEGTPTATKGTVSNHSVSVTPSVTNTTGYISGSTKTGTAVTVSASELVSGTYTVDSSGTKDVTNYASASVPAGTAGTPSATKGSVSNHSVTVTPSVTNTTGWITGGTKSGTAVTVTASELASGNKAITDNGTNIDVVGYSTVSVAVPFSTIYSGTSDPSSSTGANGDIYVKTAN